jgi:hypothetical protein
MLSAFRQPNCAGGVNPLCAPVNENNVPAKPLAHDATAADDPSLGQWVMQPSITRGPTT